MEGGETREGGSGVGKRLAGGGGEGQDGECGRVGESREG